MQRGQSESLAVSQVSCWAQLSMFVHALQTEWPAIVEP